MTVIQFVRFDRQGPRLVQLESRNRSTSISVRSDLLIGLGGGLIACYIPEAIKSPDTSRIAVVLRVLCTPRISQQYAWMLIMTDT